MIKALEDAGHECTVHLYDRHGGDLDRRRAVIRSGWPQIKAPVFDATHGIAADIGVATSWESAHALAAHSSAMRRIYFIQDYEPYFYAHGWDYALAEDSYRFGFRCVALGPGVARVLDHELGIQSDVVEFGCDADVYRLKRPRPRSGIAYFARPGVARRGYTLGRLALERFSELRPNVPIHVFGSDAADLECPAVRHGKTNPAELNELYNQCVAGLALSFTNVSLVPEEMLAAGIVPVCNDSVFARACLNNSYVVWAAADPSAICDALIQLVDSPPDSIAVARSVVGRGWAKATAGLVEIVEQEGYGT